jgi:hypothetical protein
MSVGEDFPAVGLAAQGRQMLEAVEDVEAKLPAGSWLRLATSMRMALVRG